jgi:DNA-binding SARP family transcriptional activator/TolB-like protein
MTPSAGGKREVAPFPLRLQTLGSIDVRATTETGSIEKALQPKRIALLAYLAVEGDGLTRRDLLVAMFWAELDHGRARAALRKALHAIRASFGANIIVSRGEQVGLDTAAIWCDAHEFRSLVAAGQEAEALSLYRGDFLPGLNVPDAPEFDQWIDQERRALRATATACALKLAERSRAAGSPNDAIAWARRAVEISPLEERPVRALMEALEGAGDSSAALQEYERFARELARALDVAPGDTTRRVSERLRNTLPPNAAPVSVQPLHAAPQPVRESSPVADAVVPGFAPSATRKASRWRNRALLLVPVLAIVAVTAALTLWRSRTAARGEHHRLLVHPFSYRGVDERGYLGTGIADEISARLSHLPALELLASTALASEGARSTSPLEAARRVRADLVLEGSVQTQQSGTRLDVRVTSRLIAARDGYVLWSSVYDGELSDILAVQAAIADSAAHRMAITLSAEHANRITKPPTRSSEAFDFYLRAGEYLRRGRDGLPGAIDLLGMAIERDSNFALALARYGETQARLNWYERDLDPVRMRRARALIERAIAIDPYLPEAHLALGYWLLYDRRAYSAALAQLDTVLMLRPSHAEALAARAQIRRRLGNWDGAAQDFEASLGLDPLSYAVSLELGNTLMLMRQYTRAAQFLHKARDLSPDAVDPIAWLAALALRSTADTARAATILIKGTSQVDAHQLLGRMLQTFPDVMRAIQRNVFPSVSELTLEHAFGDTAAYHVMMAKRPAQRSEARAHIDAARMLYEARAQADTTAYGPQRRLAELWVLLGDPNTALRYARRSVALMPVTLDAMAGSTALQSLAEVEIAAGQLDSATAHVATLLRIPSALSEAAVRIDPLWAPIRANVLR